MDTIHLKTNQHVTVTANPVSPDGQAGFLVPSNIPTWNSNDTTIATVAPAADGLSAVVTAVGKIGTVQIDVSAQIIAFGPNFSSSFLVTVDPNPADHFTFSFAIPENN